ncbi:MAG: CoA-binding protein, partial [Calditrichales bacterium]
IAEKIGFPVVMKVFSDDIVHKFDVKGVYLNVNSAKEAREAYQAIHKNVSEKMPEAKVTGIYVAKMITGGEEVILGVKRDPSFGPVIMFGLGGIFVEIFRDVNFRVAPVNEQAAEEMILNTRSSGMLTGARGRTPRDIAMIRTCIQRLSQLAIDCPQIKELDINPMIVLDEGKGCFVADAKIML